MRVVTGRRLRAVLRGLALAGLPSASACADGFLPPGVLAEEPEVLALSVAVVEDGRYGEGLAPLPAGRRRAEVLPLDVIELDALVADGEGVLDLDDAAWVMCAAACIPSLEVQGQRGGLPLCEEVSAPSFAVACLAGRGAHPRLRVWDVEGSSVLQPFLQLGVVVGGRHGPSTDECLRQLVDGSPTDLWGCGIGARNLTYGPAWAMSVVLEDLGGPSTFGGLPEVVTERLPPNAAPRIEQVRVSRTDDPAAALEGEAELRSIDETIEVETGGWITIDPVVPAFDRQLVLEPVGPEQWVGHFETVWYRVWTDDPRVRAGDWFTPIPGDFTLHMPGEPASLQVYVTVEDERGATSWFVLPLQVVSR